MKHRRGNLGFLHGADENQERKTRLAAIEARIDCLVRAKNWPVTLSRGPGKADYGSLEGGLPFRRIRQAQIATATARDPADAPRPMPIPRDRRSELTED